MLCYVHKKHFQIHENDNVYGYGQIGYYYLVFSLLSLIFYFHFSFNPTFSCCCCFFAFQQWQVNFFSCFFFSFFWNKNRQSHNFATSFPFLVRLLVSLSISWFSRNFEVDLFKRRSSALSCVATKIMCKCMPFRMNTYYVYDHK